MDDFLRSSGAVDETYGSTWVVVPERGSGQILAFYTIDPDPILNLTYGKENVVPVNIVQLQMLRVDKRFQRRGIGTRLLWRVVRQVVSVATSLSISGLLLTALNQKAKDWYLSSDLDFSEVAPGSMHMLLTAATMHMILGSESLLLPPEGF